MKQNRTGLFLRLVGYECRKAYGNLLILLFVLLLLVFNGWKIWDSYRQETDPWEPYTAQYEETYAAYGGKITAEKAGAITAIYAPLEAKWNTMSLSYAYSPDAYTYSEGMDEDFYRTLFVSELKYDYFYQNEAYRITQQALALAQLYEASGNDFEARKNRIIAEDFSGRRIENFTDTRGYEVLLMHDYSSMLILLLSVFALSSVFVTERESDMYMLLRTTRHGAGRTVAAKLVAAAAFILSVCVLFYTEDFLVIYLVSDRNQALQNPVYALRYFEATPLTVTVGGYFLWAAALKTLGALCWGCVILLISSLFQQVLPVFFASLALIIGGAALQEASRTRYALRWWNPMELLFPRELVNTDSFVNLLGQPVRLYGFVLLGLGLIAVGLILGILYCNQSYHSRLKRRERHAAGR